MRIVWGFLLLINVLIALRFYMRPDLVIATKFSWLGEVLLEMSGRQYSRYMLAMCMFPNIILVILYIYSHQSRFFKYARFPSRNYWKKTPDLRLEALQKFQFLFLLIGLFFNVKMLLTQMFIQKMNFARAEMPLTTIVGHHISIVFFILLPVLFFYKTFKRPK
ncbi:MAG: hypothetical protein A2Z20_09150 [Bdellovibrionales bacterium RBG_16_40_8]|nr:MAG: hypothetical protein A2Z20_09150 [Bdellovibrionales bacterium RBG_16_40_8]